MIAPLPSSSPTAAAFEFLVQSARPRRLRNVRDFAADELVIPDKGGKWRPDRQPWQDLWFRAIDADEFRSYVLQGPTQSGKTYGGFVVPVLWHLCERQENVVVGVPDLAMGANKWAIDLKPSLESSPRLSAFLPTHGAGSKGGTITNEVTLSIGTVLRFMTAGGSDESKAGFTARVLAVTEAKRFSEASAGSVESSPIEQLRGRLQSHRRIHRREFLEGTVGVDYQLPWIARKHSTQSIIIKPCVHCGVFVCPGRDDLLGWQEAETSEQAGNQAAFYCPQCGEKITDAERRRMNRDSILLHAGQTINERGDVVGDAPATDRLFFHYSAFDNNFNDAGDFAVEEWRLSKAEEGSPEADDLARKCSQQIWSIPFEEPELELVTLRERDVNRATGELPRGVCPQDSLWLTIGVDLGMYRCHWVAVAWRQNGTLAIVEYDTFEVLRRNFGDSKEERRKAVQIKLYEALIEFKDRCKIGWPMIGGDMMDVDLVLIDRGYLPDVVHQFCRVAKPPFYPSLGYGVGQSGGETYRHAENKNRTVRVVGENYHVRYDPKRRGLYYANNADAWKQWAQQRFKVDAGELGSVSLFADPARKHRTFIRHLKSEYVKREPHKVRGWVERFYASGTANHYLDAYYNACIAGHYCGFRILPTVEEPAADPPKQPTDEPRLQTPDGREW